LGLPPRRGIGAERMSAPLTAADLLELTGYQRAADQARALRAIGMRPIIGRDGRPRVTWEAVNQAIAGAGGSDAASSAANVPDWPAMARRA
jgi:hypothetical protein